MLPSTIENQEEERVDHSQCRQNLRANLLCECLQVRQDDLEVMSGLSQMKIELNDAEKTLMETRKHIYEKRQDLNRITKNSINNSLAEVLQKNEKSML
jgi:hypothetical protein